MICNKKAHVIFLVAYAILAGIGTVYSIGWSAQRFQPNFYVYYTNWSNYLCMGLLWYVLILTLRQKGNRPCYAAPTAQLAFAVMILVTFFVYHLLLMQNKTFLEYVTSPVNLLFHLTLPLAFFAHWLLFCPHGYLKWYSPFFSLIFPALYISGILIRAALFPNATLRYPYFFLNVETLQWSGFLGWVGILALVFVALTYLLYALDVFLGRRFALTHRHAM